VLRNFPDRKSLAGPAPVNSRPVPQARAYLSQQKRPAKTGRATIWNNQNKIIINIQDPETDRRLVYSMFL
jgi:hypothetical protein